MAAAYPIWELLSPSPEAGLVSTEDMLATIITSIPSRIQATPKDEATRVCHRLHGSRSILAGTWVSIVLVSLITHLPRFPLDLRWCPSVCVASSVGNPNLQKLRARYMLETSLPKTSRVDMRKGKDWQGLPGSSNA